MEFAQKLKFLIERDSVSRGKLARAVGVHTSTVTNWLSGKEPKIERLVKVSEFFNVPVAYLTGDIDDPSDRSKTHWAELYYGDNPSRENFEVGPDGLPFYGQKEKPTPQTESELSKERIQMLLDKMSAADLVELMGDITDTLKRRGAE